MSAGIEFEARSDGVTVNPCVVRMPEPTPESELTTEAKRTHLKPLPRPADYTPPSGWILNFVWNPISKGDCTMYDAAVYIYPDGQVYFFAYTKTSSDDDVWIINYMQFFDANGSQIGQAIGKHDGQNMAFSGYSYPFAFWDAIPGALPEAITRIHTVSINNRC